ncbi:MAG: hypothetical protein R3330_07325, partial [Saprospiraceae bacterium]|nr:hypothetical protein [Saprospiraceae bacterium]
FSTFQTTKDVAQYYVEEFNRINPQSRVMPKVEWDEERVWVSIRTDLTDGLEFPNEDEAEQVMTDLGDIEEAYEQAEATALEQQNNYAPVFLTKNAITLTNKVQIIIRFWGTPEEIHKNYDFVHCTCWWTPKDKVVTNTRALEAMMARELVYVGSRYPFASMVRARKFVMRGWTINAGQLLKIALQISELDFTNLEVLTEQLTGVDVFYFQQIIDYIKDKGESQQLTTAYILEITDRMF